MTPAHPLRALPLVAEHDARLMPELWPADTAFHDDDVMVDGVSMRLTGLSGTPAAFVAPAASPAATHDPSVTLIVTRVEAVLPRRVGRGLDVWVDAELDRIDAIVAQSRLIGRVSGHARRRVHLRPERGVEALALLPGDLARGDLLVLPCRGEVALSPRR